MQPGLARSLQFMSELQLWHSRTLYHGFADSGPTMQGSKEGRFPNRNDLSFSGRRCLPPRESWSKYLQQCEISRLDARVEAVISGALAADAVGSCVPGAILFFRPGPIWARESGFKS